MGKQYTYTLNLLTLVPAGNLLVERCCEDLLGAEGVHHESVGVTHVHQAGVAHHEELLYQFLTNQLFLYL